MGAGPSGPALARLTLERGGWLGLFCGAGYPPGRAGQSAGRAGLSDWAPDTLPYRTGL